MPDRPAPPGNAEPERIGPESIGPRLDKWLWHARFFRTRTLAGKLCAGGRVRVNGVPAAKAHYRVRCGDVLTCPQAGRIRVVEVRGFGLRRGPAAEARTLYADLAPPESPGASRAEPPPASRRDAGRPTKAERRALDRLRDGLRDGP